MARYIGAHGMKRHNALRLLTNNFSIFDPIQVAKKFVNSHGFESKVLAPESMSGFAQTIPGNAASVAPSDQSPDTSDASAQQSSRCNRTHDTFSLTGMYLQDLLNPDNPPIDHARLVAFHHEDGQQCPMHCLTVHLAVMLEPELQDRMLGLGPEISQVPSGSIRMIGRRVIDDEGKGSIKWEDLTPGEASLLPARSTATTVSAGDAPAV